MKKMFFSLVFLLVTSLTFADESIPAKFVSGKITVTETNARETTKVAVTFYDLESFKNYEYDGGTLNDQAPERTATIEVTVMLSKGVESTTLTVKLEKVPSGQITKMANELKANVLEAA
jgi:hypothetical protein